MCVHSLLQFFNLLPPIPSRTTLSFFTPLFILLSVRYETPAEINSVLVPRAFSALPDVWVRSRCYFGASQ